MNEYQLYIGGAFVSPAEGGRFISNNPWNRQPVASAARATGTDVSRAVASARAAVEGGPWPRMSTTERAAVLKSIAEKITQHSSELVALEVEDSGSTIRKAKEDVYLSARNLNGFARIGVMQSDEPIDAASRAGISRNILVREPVGVVAAIIPWNFPLKMAIWKLGPALAAGNAVILKPSEETPSTAMELARFVHECGVPPGVVNILTGFGAEVGGALVNHPGVDKIAFTGSTAVGRTIMREAAATLKNLTLECGGKSANIVLDDADPAIAIDGALYAAFYHQGQCCEAGTRLFLPEALADNFVAAMTEKVRRMVLGDPSDPATDIGPLISAKQKEKVLRSIDLGKKEGARLVVGGKAPDAPALNQGFFVEPTIFDHVDNRSAVAQEEIFGPVLSVIRYKSVDDAVRMANESIYGLAGGVWSKNADRAMEVARRLRAGTIWINEWHLLNEWAPFGGYKQSGIGREFGMEGLSEYTEAKHIHIDEAMTREKKSWYDVVVRR